MERRIGFFLQNSRQGGVDTFVINLLNYWPSNDKLILFCNQSHPGLTFLRKKLKKKIKIIKYRLLLRQDINKYLYFSIFINKIISTYLIVIGFILNIFRIKKILLSSKINELLVINGGYPGGEACLAATIAWKKIFPNKKNLHNFHSHIENNLKFYEIKNLFLIIINYLFKIYDIEFIAVSKSCLKSLKKIPIFNKQKKSYIYNGIDTTNRINKVKKNIASTKKNKILLLSNYSSNKGIIFAIDVLKLVLKKNNCELIIAGDSKKDEYNLVERYINNLNIKKFVKLKKFEKNVFNLIKKTNILIVTTRNYEAFNYSIIEAMAMKKPVIASKVGGISEIVRHMETGFLINKNNKLQFAKCINLLLKNKKLSKKYGNAGYLRYKNNFLSEKMSIKYFNAITS